MNTVLERYGEPVGRGKIPGILYDVGRYPGAVKTTATRAFVRGEVYLLRDADRALRVLDRYEGWDEKKPRSGEFRRSRAVVDLGGGKTVKAWIYLYNRPTTGLTRIRSGNYLEGPAGASRMSEKRSR
ncbi:MAG: gamma-glutamylcyclotransferase family protein [Acidobacteriota bacterium]